MEIDTLTGPSPAVSTGLGRRVDNRTMAGGVLRFALTPRFISGRK